MRCGVCHRPARALERDHGREGWDLRAHSFESSIVLLTYIARHTRGEWGQIWAVGRVGERSLYRAPTPSGAQDRDWLMECVAGTRRASSASPRRLRLVYSGRALSTCLLASESSLTHPLLLEDGDGGVPESDCELPGSYVGHSHTHCVATYATQLCSFPSPSSSGAHSTTSFMPDSTRHHHRHRSDHWAGWGNVVCRTYQDALAFRRKYHRPPGRTSGAAHRS